MKTIKDEITNILEIKQSKFITIIKPIQSLEEKDKALVEAKTLYPKATHYCYGFILVNEKGLSDDGEPTKTAGAPILNVLEKQQLTNVIAVVIRYFGGIKLGPGGLIRAYTKSVLTSLEKGEFIFLEKGYIVTISFPFKREKDVCYLFKENPIYNKQYNESCHYTIGLKKEQMDNLPSFLKIEKEKEQYISFLS